MELQRGSERRVLRGRELSSMNVNQRVLTEERTTGGSAMGSPSPCTTHIHIGSVVPLLEVNPCSQTHQRAQRSTL